MGASDEEMIMVSGFVGGLGLSGEACGALSAAIWLKSLNWCREEVKKSPIKNPDSKIQCSDITGQHFKNTDDYTKFIKNGGCGNLMNILAES